jgi:hypothetical protein
VSSWTLIERTLTLEYNHAAATALGFARQHALSLDVSVEELEQVRDALLEILDSVLRGRNARWPHRSLTGSPIIRQAEAGRSNFKSADSRTDFVVSGGQCR